MTVGGSVTASTEVNLFDIIGSKISVRVEAEHEWTETNSFSRTAKVFLHRGRRDRLDGAHDRHRDGDLGALDGLGEVHRHQLRPDAQWGDQGRPDAGLRQDRGDPADHRERAPGALPRRRPRAARLPGPARTPCAKRALRPGRGIGRVKLGQPRDARGLGRPLIKSPKANRSATANDCRVLDPQCNMVPGRGGTWVYDDLNVVFGADRRVSALIYSGRGRSAAGVGVGSSLRAVRAAYPGASCLTYPRQANCALNEHLSVKGGQDGVPFHQEQGPTQVRPGTHVLRRRAARGGGRMTSELRRRVTARRAWLAALAGGMLAVGSAGSVALGQTQVIDAGTDADAAAEALNRDVRTCPSATGRATAPSPRMTTVPAHHRGRALQLQRNCAGPNGGRRERRARRDDQPLRIGLAGDHRGFLGFEKTSVDFEAFSKQSQGFSTTVQITQDVSVPPGYKG